MFLLPKTLKRLILSPYSFRGIGIVIMLHWRLNGFILCFNDGCISIDFIKLPNAHVDTIGNGQKLIPYSSEAHSITLLFYVIPV